MDSALTCASAITEPCGSMTMPEIFAVCVCAAEPGATDKAIKKAAKERKNNTRTEKRMRVLLSRFAREVKVVRVSGIVSGLAAADFVGLLARRHCVTRGLPASAFETVARAEFLRLTVARRRRVCTVFPARSLRWLWRRTSASRLGRDAATLRVNDLAEREIKRAAQQNFNQL